MCAHNSQFTHGQIAVAHGEATISLWPISSGKFPWIRQKEQKNYPWQFPRYVLLGNKNPEAAQPITRKWNVLSSRNHVLFTSWVRLGDKSYAKTDLKVRKFSMILSTVVDVFQVFTLNKFKSTLKHSQVFFKISVQEFFSYEVVAIILVNPYFWLASENLG